MHAGGEWHNFKWKDTLVGQKSSKCKQASKQSLGSSQARCSIKQHLNKKEKEKRKDKKKG